MFLKLRGELLHLRAKVGQISCAAVFGPGGAGGGRRRSRHGRSIAGLRIIPAASWHDSLLSAYRTNKPVRCSKVPHGPIEHEGGLHEVTMVLSFEPSRATTATRPSRVPNEDVEEALTLLLDDAFTS
jgi:hypothetical protein